MILLSIFSLTILHTLLPHVHHTHEDGHANTEIHEHYDTTTMSSDHDEHDGDHHEEFSFLSHFFEGHSHQYTLDETIVLTEESKQLVVAKKQNVIGIRSRAVVFIAALKERDASRYIYTVNAKDKFYLDSFPYRGPPSVI